MIFPSFIPVLVSKNRNEKNKKKVKENIKGNNKEYRRIRLNFSKDRMYRLC